MNIVLVHPQEVSDGCFSFFKNDERFLHIKKVLKLTEGDTFKGGIINGAKGTAEIISFTEHVLTARFVSLSDTAKEGASLPPIRLMLGFPRPIQLRRIVRDVVSLGIESLYLIGTELGEKSYMHASLAEEAEIVRLFIDGASQAGQTYIPQVYRVYSLRSFFNQYGDVIRQEHLKAVLDVPLHGDTDATLHACTISPLSHLKWDGKRALWLAVGSERGWSTSERELFAEQVFFSYTMGHRILRTETAVTAAVSVCLAQSGLWG